MSIVEEIQSRVTTQADAMGGEVLVRAIRSMPSHKCSGCNFQENIEQFAVYLHRYSYCKCVAHHARRRIEQMDDKFYYSTRDYSQHKRDYWTQQLLDAECDIIHFRGILRGWWPCSECKRFFNPTGMNKFKCLAFRPKDLSDLFEETNERRNTCQDPSASFLASEIQDSSSSPNRPRGLR